MSLRAPLQRLIPFRPGMAPSPLLLLRVAARHRCTVRLFFLGQQRQMENIPCRIERVDRQGLVLHHAGACPTDALERLRCSIYFKLPLPAHILLPGLSRARSHEGFLGQTRIMAGTPLPDGSMRLQLGLPKTILQRELRRHERYFTSPGCVDALELWLPWDAPAAALPSVGTASFCSSRQHPRLHLVNLSAGGAKLQIDMVDFTEELANMDLKYALVRLRLHALHLPQPESWLFCRCVESRYNIPLHRLVLRLCFSQYRDAGDACWSEVGEQGVPALQHWLTQEYPSLAGTFVCPASRAGSPSDGPDSRGCQ